MNLTNFIQNALTRKDNLFRAIYQFNELISLYIDESHVGQFPSIGNNWKALRSVKRVQVKLSKLLQKLFKLEGRTFYHFEEPRLRLALMEGRVLNELLTKVGAVYYSERIGRIILKREVLDLKKSIGEDIYFFATKKASLIKNLAPKIETPELKELTRDDLMEVGKLCLEICFAGEDKALTDRLILKMPSKLEWDFERPISEGAKMQAWKFLHRILIKEINPDLEICFT